MRLQASATTARKQVCDGNHCKECDDNPSGEGASAYVTTVTVKSRVKLWSCKVQHEQQELHKREHRRDDDCHLCEEAP